jgi:hypothetical protein
MHRKTAADSKPTCKSQVKNPLLKIKLQEAWICFRFSGMAAGYAAALPCSGSTASNSACCAL